jgi:hypothetical protein
MGDRDAARRFGSRKKRKALEVLRELVVEVRLELCIIQ